MSRFKQWVPVKFIAHHESARSTRILGDYAFKLGARQLDVWTLGTMVWLLKPGSKSPALDAKLYKKGGRT